MILIAASVFRLQYIGSIPQLPFLNEMTKTVSAVTGILSVAGLYFLAKRLFNWQIAALSSYLMAISFWHVYFSRMGSSAITASMLLVWGMLFLWHGLSTNKLYNFAISGVFWGLGFYTYSSFQVMPLALILTILAYWHSVKKDFGHEKYLHTRNQIIRGLALFLITVILIVLPTGYYFWQSPTDFLGHVYQVSVFATQYPLEAFAKNAVLTLGMFNFSAQPLLIWPVGVLFALGFLRSFIKLVKVKKRHGHFSTIQTMLLSWFFIGLAPVMLSNEGSPSALRALIVAPVVFVWAGEGLWWIMGATGDWYHTRDIHEYRFQHKWLRESSFVAVLAIVILLASLTIAEYDKYFNKWAKNTYNAPFKN